VLRRIVPGRNFEEIPGIKIKNVDSVTAAIMDIKFGKSLATTIDHSLVSGFQAQYPEIKVLNLPLPPSEQSLGNGICINKDNQELVSQVRKAVDELRAEGKIAELEKKNGNSDESYLELFLDPILY
jgi:ABC-type amino acid transport substrate-binding protein